jgi:Beta-lactamase
MPPTFSTVDIASLRSNVLDPAIVDQLSAINVDVESMSSYFDKLHQSSSAFQTGVTSYFPKQPNFKLPAGSVSKSKRKIARVFDFEAFAKAVHADLSVAPISGYTLQIRKDGQTVYTLFWNWARRPQDSPELGWKPTVKMHVASVSKLVTAMAVVKLLHDKGISYDTPISNFLPEYFVGGPNAGRLTFRHFLTHTSGMIQVGAGGPNDGYTFTEFKNYYEQGVVDSNIGSYNYHNGNFIALRIAMCVLTGALRRDFKISFGLFSTVGLALTDSVWDSVSTTSYVNYVTQNILVPSFCQASLSPPGDGSLAYSMNLGGRGALFNAEINAGTAGWWFSADEIVNIMNTFWQSDAIVPKSVARSALRAGLGVEAPSSWQLFRGVPDCFIKSGYWSDNANDTQQCVVAFAPGNIELAIFVNSPVPSTNVRNVAAWHMLKNIK